jgi:translocation and assembly module TamB
MKAKAKHRVWRWTKRIVLGLLAFTVIAVATLVIVLHTDYGRNVVRSQVEEQMSMLFTGGATIGKVEGSVFGTLVVRDVVVNGPDHKPAITIKKLQLQLGLKGLFSHDAKLSGLVAEDVDIDLRRDERGELQIKSLLAPSPKSGWSVDLADISIRRVRVAYDTGTEVMHFDDLDLVGTANVPLDKPIDATATVHGKWRERAADVGLTVAVHVTPDHIDISKLDAHAGDVSVAATSVSIVPVAGRRPIIGGSFVVKGSRVAVAQLFPQVDLPDDIEAKLEVTPVADEPWTRFVVDGKLGATPVAAVFSADLDKHRALGFVSTGELDLGKLTRGRIVARVGGFAAFEIAQGEAGELPIGHALIQASGTYAEFPATVATIGLTSTGERVTTSIRATNSALAATLGADLLRHGDSIVLEHGTLVATTGDPARASAGKAPVHGSFDINLAASGALLPEPNLAVSGKITGARLRMQDLSVASLTLAIDARQLPRHPRGKAELRATGVESGDLFLRELAVTAANRDDGKIAVSLQSRPKQDPWLVDADALVTLGDTISIELARHHVRAGNGTDWAGTTGHIAISGDRIDLRDFTSSSGTSSLAVAGSFHRGSGDLVAKVDATAINLESLSTAYHGTVDAHVDLERHGGRFGGSGTVKAIGLSLDPDPGHPASFTMDATAKFEARGGKLVVDATASAANLGLAKLALDIDAPANIADAGAWKRLGRDAIRTVDVTLENVDIARAAKLANLPGEYAGRIDGKIQISATTIGGNLELQNFVAPELRGAGSVGAKIQIVQTAPNELTPTLAMQINGVGGIRGWARLGMPDHLFDPAAWKQLGRGVLRGGELRADNIAVDPGWFERAGIVTTLHGKASILAEVSDSARSAKLGITVRELRGGALAEPIDLEATALIDEKTTRTTIKIHTHPIRNNKVTGPAVLLVDVDGTTPLTLPELLANPRGALEQPLHLTAKLPNVPAKLLLGVFGRSEVIAGALDGTIEIGGTLGKPTAVAKLVGTNIQVPPGPGGRPVKTIKRLSVDASWNGTVGKLVVDGTQEGGSLQLVAEGSPFALADANVTLKAKQFDMVPLLVFAPGPAGAGAGRLDADLTLHGLDARTMRPTGEVHLTGARIPIAPTVGTLRRAKIDIVIHEHDIALTLDARLGGGTVKAKGTIAMDGASPTGGDATITLRKVSPIGVVEPDIDADVTMKLHREDLRWIADVDVRNGNVVVPDERRAALKPVGAPTDMVFMSGEPITRRPMVKEAPARPVIIANITLHPAFIKSTELRTIVKGKVTVTADVDSIGIVGTIEADRGDLDLFGRRYQVERAMVRFDGTIDPLLDVLITHDFVDITTITQLRGRLSAPELTMSSNPGTYSEGQLLGFLLGGEPSGDPGDAGDRASSVGASFVANKLGGYVKRALPIDLDVLRYESATASTSAAITVGSWLGRDWFIAYRQHLESRPDENTGEGEVEYWLSRRVFVEATAGDRGKNGIDLLWRKRY